MINNVIGFLLLQTSIISGIVVPVGLFVWVLSYIPFAYTALVLAAMWCMFASSEFQPEMRHWSIWRYIYGTLLGMEAEGEEVVLGKDRPTLVAVYPHGHFSLSLMGHFVLNERYQHLHPAGHSWIFYVPIVATFAKRLGAIPVDRSSLVGVLSAGKHVVMCPGGVSGMTYDGNDIDDTRTGFLRVAKETNALVYPVWCPEERNYFSHWMPLGRLLQPYLGFPFPYFLYGIPKPVDKSPIRIGEPIEVEEVEDARVKFYESIRRMQTPVV